MKIGIISDTHDHAPGMLRAFDLFRKHSVKVIIHCGDWVAPFMLEFCKDAPAQVYGVFGNNEGERETMLQKAKDMGIHIEPMVLSTEIEGCRIAVTHGHTDDLQNLLQGAEYDLVCSGHTHTAIVEKHGNTVHINPGTITGFKNMNLSYPRTVALFDTVSAKAEIVKL